MSDELTLKITVIGDNRVGLTSILMKYFNVEVRREYNIKRIVFHGRKIRVIALDTNSAQYTNWLPSGFFQGSHTYIFVYDQTDNDSVTNLHGWFADLKRYGRNKGRIPHYLCCNKIDCERTIDEDMLKRFLEEHPMKEYAVCALTGEGIDEMFEDILPDTIEEAIRQLKERGKPIPPPLPQQSHGKDCCLQ